MSCCGASMQMRAPECGAPRHTLLVFTALLRLLRAEVARVKTEHSATESHLRRVTSRADRAASEIVALEEEVGSLQAEGLANSDTIRSLRQRIAKLESRLADKEEKRSDKEEELLSLHNSYRSVPRIWRADSFGPSTSCGQSTGRDCSESTDDDFASNSVYELSPVELESPSVWLAEAESILETERILRKDLEERFALLEAQLAEGNAAAELMCEELGEARLVIARLEKRSAVMETDCANALVVAADAEDALCAAETVTVNASEELQKAFERAASAEAEVASLRSRIAEVDDELEQIAKLLDAEQQRSREVSQKQAFQSREMLDHFEHSHRERAELQRQQIAALQKRLAATETDRDQKLRDFQWLDGERQEVLALQRSIALREAERDIRAQDSERRDRELDARCVEAAELAAELSVAKAAQDSAVQELHQQRQQCAAVSAERYLAWRMLESQEVDDVVMPVEVHPVCAAAELPSAKSPRSGPQLVCGPEADVAPGPAIVQDFLAQAVLLHQSSRPSGSKKAPPTKQKQSETSRANPLLRSRNA